MADKIERQVHFMLAQIYDAQDTEDNNTWNYNRAPDGYLFELVEATLIVGQYDTLINGLFAIFDGHEYTNWDIWPGVQSQEILGRVITNAYQLNGHINLNGWECKEYTLGIRSTSSETAYKVCAVVWYFLKKANRMELLEYAVKHPRNQDMFRYALRGTTVEPSE